MARQKDLAEQRTDELLEELEEKIYKEYREAYENVKAKYDDYMKKYIAEDQKKLEQVQNGTLSMEEYSKWAFNKAAYSKQAKELVDTLAADLTLVDKKVMSMVNGYLPEAYALNYNYSTYEIETSHDVDTSFVIYSRETVENLIKNDPTLLPKRKVDIPKDKRWNKSHLNSAITQGILSGEDIRTISKRFQQVTDMDRRAAIRNSRTMMTGAQNAGRMDAFDRAISLGINVQKEWMATLDSRTRDSHQHLDGERAEYDKKFSNGLRYPGDPEGAAEEVYNCRCTLVPFYPDYEGIIEKRITYDEWMQSKIKPQNIEIQPEEDLFYKYDHTKLLNTTYDHSIYTESDLERLDELYSNAPEELQMVYDKYASDFNMIYNDTSKGSGYFSRSEEKVHVNCEIDRSGSDYQTKYELSSHEFGHYMDYLCGGKSSTYLSMSYLNENGLSFKDIIFRDWENLFMNEYSNVKNITDPSEIFKKLAGRSAKKADEYIQSMMSKARRAIVGESDEAKNLLAQAEREYFALWNRGIADYRSFFKKYENLFGKYLPVDHYVEIPKDVLEDFAKAIRNEYILEERGNLSDMFEQFSLEHGGSDYPFGVGHGKDYWNRYGALEKETFAEITAALIANGDSLMVIQKYLPNVYDAYIDMLRRLLNEAEK